MNQCSIYDFFQFEEVDCPFTKELSIVLRDHNWWDVINNPWLILFNWEKMQNILTKSIIENEFSKEIGAGGYIWIHNDAKILPGTYIEGPAIVGPGSIIGPNCTLRSFVLLDSNVTVGQGAEIKASVVLSGSYLQHFCYLGHSLLGRNCSFSAGVITATSRLDRKTIRVNWKGKMYESHLFKLGSIIGDNVRFGVSVSIMPGKFIAPGCLVPPNSTITKDFLCG